MKSARNHKEYAVHVLILTLSTRNYIIKTIETSTKAPLDSYIIDRDRGKINDQPFGGYFRPRLGDSWRIA